MAASDVGRCARVLADKCSLEGHDPELIPRIWPELLGSGRMKAVAVEAPDGEIITFGASVFLTDEFAHRLAVKATPFIGKDLMRSALDSPSPICTVETIARGNATSGLNVFILHSGIREIQERSDVLYIKSQLMSSFLEVHRGYQVSNLLVEAYGARERLLYEATLFRVVCDHSASRDRPLHPTHQEPAMPCLLQLSRDEVARFQSHAFLPLFVYRHPLCGFSSNEQDLLCKALEGHTDEELATALNVSVSAVKKRWISILEKAEGCFPGLVASSHSNSQKEGRGPQRRHVLLRMLRTRPEELTPYRRTRAEKRSRRTL